jgi:hypothetical protein
LTATAVFVLLLAIVTAAGAASVPEKGNPYAKNRNPEMPPSGVLDYRDVDLGTGITECPQAGQLAQEQPLDKREIDTVEQLSRRGDDRRSDDDYSCFPQNEVSIDLNPKNEKNFVIGANDYRLGTGSSGFHATSDGGRSFYSGIIPFPSGPGGQTRGEGLIPSGGDPVIAYDRDGVVYYAQIGFYRGDDTNGVFVQRSTNGGFTWSRACIPQTASDTVNRCGGTGDARQPGDGVVQFDPDPDGTLNGVPDFNDKEWMTTGPRPTGVSPVCFTPVTRTPTPCAPEVVGVDRIYVTWTRFTADNSEIYISYSDDQGRSWSRGRPISGSAAFCVFSPTSTPNRCDFDQASVPTVSPHTGHLYVAFINGNTPDENQYLMVRSTDGGNTFAGPFFVTPIYDINFPRAGYTRPDCVVRGQQTARIVYTNSCFRSNAYGNIAVDERGGAFADDLYVVISDNRNGTPASSNADVFLFKSNDGGTTWIGPTRVNDDRSVPPPNRDCGRFEGLPPVDDDFIPGFPDINTACGGVVDYGNDQWWPWVDIGENGELNVAFKDRRLDRDSQLHEWPTSRSRPGNYLVWTWGAQCKVSRPDSRECLAPGAAVIPQPTAPINPGSGPQPGQGPSYLGGLKNLQVSDPPSNYDYSFRAGIFAGDYENIVVGNDRRGGGGKDDFGDDRRGGDDDAHGSDAQAYNVFTDARNGRSSRDQPGRNPICEQSDVFFDIYSALNGNGTTGGPIPQQPFLVTPCPAQAVEPQGDRGRHHEDDDRDDRDRGRRGR